MGERGREEELSTGGRGRIKREQKGGGRKEGRVCIRLREADQQFLYFLMNFKFFFISRGKSCDIQDQQQSEYPSTDYTMICSQVQCQVVESSSIISWIFLHGLYRVCLERKASNTSSGRVRLAFCSLVCDSMFLGLLSGCGRLINSLFILSPQTLYLELERKASKMQVQEQSDLPSRDYSVI